MPYKPKKPCAYPGCPNTTNTTFCYNHNFFENQHPPRQRNSFYNSSEWKKARKEFLLDHPVCVFCGRPAVIVDHAVPIKDGGAPLEPINFQELC